MATDRERAVFASKVLAPIGQQASLLPASGITGFLAMAGQSYDGALMVVGRAVNGWTDSVLPAALCEPAEVDRYATHVQKSVAGSACCPMRWVATCWGSRDDYNTRRSAFWRSIRKVVAGLGIADIASDGWPSRLVWSNLYKVAPAEGGNPGNVLGDIQCAGCVELLSLELQIYRPSRVLFLTGSDWAAPFLSMYKFEKTAGFQYVEQAGVIGGARCLVAAHPQGRPEDAWTGEVLAAFDSWPAAARAADATSANAQPQSR